ncbi:MAG: hypothetical protein IJR86_07045 [Bacteroidaceae bacterium]|nr:hypothetical protein [Bacteroidaceae bacterium]
MTAVQLNAEVLRAMSEIADDEALMTKLLKYIKKLSAKKEDPTLMTKDEFYARIEEAERQYERGEYTEMLPNEDLATHLKRLGYEI